MLLTIKNLGGPTLLHTVRGSRAVEPGASITAEFSDAQANAYRDEPKLDVSEATAEDPEPRPVANRARKEIEKAAKR
jgi:hypothetical protein